MTTQRKITGKTQAWLPEHSGPQLLNTDPNNVVSSVTLYQADTDDEKKGWRQLGYTYIGEAEVTLTIVDEPGIIDSKVESLRETRAKVLADAQMKATEIEAQINQLLAIENNPTKA